MADCAGCRADSHLPAPSVDAAGAAAADADAAAAVVGASGCRVRAHAAADQPRRSSRAPRTPLLPRIPPPEIRLFRRPSPQRPTGRVSLGAIVLHQM